MTLHLNLIVCILLALDAATTIYALSRKGFQEANPALRWLIDRVGLAGAVLVTHAPLIALLYLLPMPAWALWAACAVGAYAVGNNAFVIWKQRQT